MFELVAGDLEPDMPLTVTVDGAAQDLSSATAIMLHWIKPDGTSSDVALTAVELATGQVKRVWASGDTDDVGYHKGRIVVTWASSEPQTFPNDGSFFWWAVYDTE